MNKSTKTYMFSHLQNAENAVSESKGNAYAGSVDVLDNFKRNAIALGLTPYQIWAVYFNKHIDSINNAIKANPASPKDMSEGLEGRIVDARTYLGLLFCLLEEEKSERSQPHQKRDSKENKGNEGQKDQAGSV